MVERIEGEPPQAVHIRPAVRTDVPVIENILRATIQTPYGSGNIGEDELAEVQMELGRINEAFDSSEKGEILLAENREGENLGFAFLGDVDSKLLDFTHSDPESTLELRLLYLDPTKRKQGVGSQLLRAVEQRARGMGRSRVELTSGPRFMSIGTGRFYKKSGYKNIGVIRNYFEDLYPAWVFQKDL